MQDVVGDQGAPERLGGASEAAVIRELIRHENELTNNRMTWFLTVEGLLFAALAFAWDTGPGLVTFVLAPLGLALCVMFRTVLIVGPTAVGHLVKWWDDNSAPEYCGPDVVGGRTSNLPRWTKWRAMDLLVWPWNGTPILLGVAWIAAGIVRFTTV